MIRQAQSEGYRSVVMVGDPNSIVSDAAKSRTKVVKFLIFVFMTLRL